MKHYRIEGKITEFQKYFNSRYMKLKSILEKRGESFSRIIDVMRSPKGSEATLIVMLLEKVINLEYIL